MIIGGDYACDPARPEQSITGYSDAFCVTQLPFASHVTQVCEALYDVFDQELYDNKGQPIANPTIRVRDRIDTYLSKGTKVYCYFDTYLAEYIAFTSVDSFPLMITGEAATTFKPQDKTATVKLVLNATLDGNNVDPEFKGYPSSPPTGPGFSATLKCYNVKRCGAVGGDLVTIQRVSMQGFDTTSVTDNQSSYVYIVIHTGENENNTEAL